MRRRPVAVPEEKARDPEAVRAAALRLLERTRRTRSDLERRLRESGFASDVLQNVIARLEAVGLVDDVEYARAWLAGRWGRRPSGWRRLEQELRGRGIALLDIAAARTRLEQEQGGADEVAAARRVVAQALRRYAALDPRARRQRLWALLVRRGFDSETIEAALTATSAPSAE